MSRIIVTGGAGFIGSYVAEDYVSRGHEVLVLDNFSTGREENLTGIINIPLLEVLNAEIQSQKAASGIANFRPDLIIHLAAHMNVRKSVENPQNDAQQNILGTINLLEASISSGCRNFVFSSTGGAIYGEQDTFPADETHPTFPECPYGVSKLCAENYLSYFAKNSPINTVSLRFGNVYGFRQNPGGEAGVVSIFVKQILNNEPLTINGDGTQTRDFIYVSDIVDAISLVSSSLLGNTENIKQLRIFNLGTGIETSVNEIADMLVGISGKYLPDQSIDKINKPQASGEQNRSLLDASRFSSEFSWKPKVSVQSGLGKTFLDTMKA